MLRTMACTMSKHSRNAYWTELSYNLGTTVLFPTLDANHPGARAVMKERRRYGFWVPSAFLVSPLPWMPEGRLFGEWCRWSYTLPLTLILHNLILPFQRQNCPSTKTLIWENTIKETPHMDLFLRVLCTPGYRFLLYKLQPRKGNS